MSRVSLLVCLVSLVILAFHGIGAANALELPARHDHGDGSEPLDKRTKPIDKRTAKEVIKKLNMLANPEKGYYAETFRDSLLINNRSASTAIYYLLEGSAGNSLWHRVDAVEVWHYYAGAPLTLSLSYNNGTGVRKVTLGPDVFDKQQPQVVIAQWEWQRAKSLGDWTLVGTTMAPAFDPNGYEIAAPNWNPS
ncbi:RmlC-like cupin domain-containing protein [Podospora didyma]|uniref:RmlC-like cupin domain-containing protein n=1 Tax=Podospora didyma TaxID=330526 RepID=A0AAE0NX13_9PEZI|nr:RmlC-like cupin domain-containing protein [Podospora didyma]